MGRKWRQQPAVLITATITPEKRPDVIEHSITKYKQPAVTTVTRQHGANTWSKERYKAHLNEIQKRGYVKGAEVVTKYGIHGTIEEFLPCPDDGIIFYGGNEPCCIRILRTDNTRYTVVYGAHELTLTKELAA